MPPRCFRGRKTKRFSLGNGGILSPELKISTMKYEEKKEGGKKKRSIVARGSFR